MAGTFSSVSTCFGEDYKGFVLESPPFCVKATNRGVDIVHIPDRRWTCRRRTTSSWRS
ncbi:hypothetical protein PPTG_22333 [Phytophthora nicotianae INRA-310]|uniref:Uncharacterized protein n=4 Tax=Phytophthora nicotianae TaxID=4792 RepID=V9FP23_PHYNI|nr:hypothetical protein PPTG_22333 [Phytophthora nicotianae INRA-310]ETI52773.1 hypothetical protein F443_04173 [Phytophthora nicotianae P1569]ETM52377.1 hypothetical protein L914_04003 [Phytophthora nicotianae]ETO81482.1 hypothetical protein F444_04229 [Phytophthora nicotianae P1976]ETI52806.1 hypothetical protein F443_04167 [Phytophthora nicotianae P1569]ETN13327.1 hypothetical protein PPTG_22333 [Phytophthora nicotianae INRA-310]